MIDEHNMGYRDKKYEGNNGLSLAIHDPYYPTFNYGEALISVPNFTHGEGSGCQTRLLGIWVLSNLALANMILHKILEDIP